MANFCTLCGTRLDISTGLCPNCNREQIAELAAQAAPVPAPVPVVEPVPAPVYVPAPVREEENIPAQAEPGYEEPKENFEAAMADAATEETVQYAPAVQDEYAVPYAAAVPQQKRESKIYKKGSKAVAILLSILLFFSAFYSCSVFLFRNSFSQGTFENIIEATEDEWCKEFDDTDFTDAMYEDYGIKIDDDSIVEFFEESTAKEFVAGKLAGFTDEIFDGETELVFTSDEIEEFLEENEDVIDDVFDIKFTKEEIKDISKMVVGDSHEYVIQVEELLDFDDFEIFDVILAALSYTAMTIALIISAVIIFVLIFNSPLRAAAGVGVNFIIIGSFFICVALAILLVFPAILSGYNDSSITIGLNVISAAAKSMLPLSITLFVLGIVLVVVRKVLLKKAKNTFNAVNQ